MALMRDGLWSIVDGTEVAPDTGNEARAKFVARRNRALATIVLSVEPSLLYLVGDPENSADAMTEIFDELSIVGDPIEEKDRVVHLLASLPESFDILVTALEASKDVPKMETVTERLLREESKLKEKEACGNTNGDVKALASKQRFGIRSPRCSHCGRIGHIKRNCRELEKKTEDTAYKGRRSKQKAYSTFERQRRDSSSSDSDTVGLLANQEFSTSTTEYQSDWIIDSGATCHMCNDLNLFAEYSELGEPQEITLGDGRPVQASDGGIILLGIKLSDNKVQRCKLNDVLYFPELAYNLLSVSKVTNTGKTLKFVSSGCEILDEKQNIVATATKSTKEKESIETTASKEGQPTVELECIKEEDRNMDETTEVEVRRSARTRKPPDYYGVRAYIADSELGEPMSAAEARSSPEKKAWEKAMESEMESLKQNEIWDLVE
eukprot:gene3204-1519_t